jgi:hypothetical protein
MPVMEEPPPAAEATLTAAGVGGTEGPVEDAGGTDFKTRVAVSIPAVRPHAWGQTARRGWCPRSARNSRRNYLF